MEDIKFYDPIIGKTKLPIYWIDGSPSFVPPEVRNKVLQQLIKKFTKADNTTST